MANYFSCRDSSKLKHSFCPSKVFPDTSGQCASYGVTNSPGGWGSQDVEIG